MAGRVYYNENDKFAAAWLRQLVADGLIADGVVDERSIADVEADELVGYRQWHFFAGIGGFSHALRQAGIPDDFPILTGSCPCQSFSVAGKQKGKADERHLWPELHRIIRGLKPQYAIGEQVAGAISHGWIDDLHADLAGEGYAVGFAVLGAHSAGQAHIRQRLYWGASRLGNAGGATGEREPGSILATETRLGGEWVKNGDLCQRHPDAGEAGGLAYANGEQADPANEGGFHAEFGGGGGLGHPERHGFNARAVGRSPGEGETEGRLLEPERPSADWDTAAVDWLYCRDGKHRPIKRGLKPLVGKFESGSEPLAYGLSAGMVRGGDQGAPEDEGIDPDDSGEARVMRLKGYGNAIQVDTAVIFIKAFLDNE